MKPGEKDLHLNVRMEKYDPEKLDAHHQVATLIYSADEEFSAIIYGKQDEGVEVIKKMMQMAPNYFTYPHVDCAVINGDLVGVLVGFPVKDKKALDQASGKCFARVFGFWAFLKKMPTMMRISHISWKEMDDQGFVVNSLCVSPSHRGKGLGSLMLEKVFETYDKVYLDVNINNDRALKFYEELGFQVKSKNTTKYKGKTIGLYSVMKGC